MRSMLLAGAGFIAILAAPVVVTAQVPPPGTVMTDESRIYALTPEQQAMFDVWTAEQRAAYAAWPYDYRVYYWTLPTSQATGWWALTDEQRRQVYAMTPEQRVAAWASIEAQLAGAPPPTVVQANPPGPGPATDTPPNPPTADSPVPPAMPADPSYQAGPYKGALTPPPAEAVNKVYPVCTSRLQDSCQNPGEGGAPRRRKAKR